MAAHFFCLLFALAVGMASPLVRAGETVVMVNIDYFSESHRERGAADARLAIAAGKPELTTDFGYSLRPPTRQRQREIAMRHKVLRGLGLIPRPYGGSECLVDPAADAYAMGYDKVTDAYLQVKLGTDYHAQIEAEVQRRIKSLR